ncbi:MAG: tRNA pseudouridine(54/55) synthase Pus10 [Candidatus Diapherotrites archaeon]
MLVFKFEPLNNESLLFCLNNIVSSVEFESFCLGVSSSKIAKENISLVASSFLVSVGKKKASVNFDTYILIDLDCALVSCVPSSVFVFGRYNKFSRSVAQTFHYCFKCKGKGCGYCNWSGKLSEFSVQEILEKVFLPSFKASSSKFHGCGREDVDVRMLGKGRPFIFELKEPLVRNLNLRELLEKANSVLPSAVFFSSFRYSSKQELIKLKNTDFEKIYYCVCVADSNFSVEKLNSIVGKSFIVVQRTPLRVLARRVDANRTKNVLIMSVSIIDSFTFSLQIKASHGLYVKEFVSGDDNRTNPSISSILGVNCVCKELDVLEIVGFD